jgi:hypothetical protein
MAVAACCGSAATAALGGAPLIAATASSVPHDVLDERRLVGTAASDLNTLAGARGARSVSPCEHKDKKANPRCSNAGPLEGRFLTSG